MSEKSLWIHWENAMTRASRLAFATGIRHQVRSNPDGGYHQWIVSPVE